METENIKPVSPVVASTPPRPVKKEAPEKAPPTPQSAPAQEPADTVSLSPDARQTVKNLHTERRLTEDDQLVIRVIDPETKEVIRQIPAEETLNLRQAIRSILDRSTEI